VVQRTANQTGFNEPTVVAHTHNATGTVLNDTSVPPANACTTFTFSDWGACQANSTQSRTVVSALPDGCTGGSPVLTQSCTYTPPADCAVPPSNAAPIIYATTTTEPTAPAARGGTIVDGTYHRVLRTKFGQSSTGPDESAASQVALTISGNQADLVATEGGVTTRSIGTLSTSGTTLTISVTCSTDPATPVGSTLTVGYTATAYALSIHSTTDNTLEVFALQGVGSQCSAPATYDAPASTDKNTTTAAPPPAFGGDITNGTYDLWVSTSYGEPSNSTATSADRRTFILADGAIEVIVGNATTAQDLVRGTYTVDVANKKLNILVTCTSDTVHQPIGSTLSVGYTVDTTNAAPATLLKIYSVSSDGHPTEEAYKKR
jgi:hypothetical protein